MHTTTVSIPKPCSKYYQSSTLEDLVELHIADVSEIEIFEKYTYEVLSANKFKFLGWAIVKPKYFDVISGKGLGILAVVLDASKKKHLVNVTNDPIEIITREQLDGYFHN